MIETLSLALIVALGLAIRFYVRARRADRELVEAGKNNRQWMRMNASLHDENVALHGKLSDTERKWLDAKSRYLDSLDEIAELKAESDRGDAA